MTTDDALFALAWALGVVGTLMLGAAVLLLSV